MNETIDESLVHIIFLAKNMQGCDVSYVALLVLLELNIPTNQVGFDFLIHAVVAFCKNPLQTMSKGIYPTVAANYDYKVSQEEIEQAIRVVIKKGWENRDSFAWKYYFSHNTSGKMKKPTNSEFISRIGRILQLWQGCCERTVGYEEK